MFRGQLMMSRLPALCLAIAAGATLGLSLACLFVPIRWDDQSFALYVAPRLLDGYHLYGADIMELQPPLIFLDDNDTGFACALDQHHNTSRIYSVSRGALLRIYTVVASLEFGFGSKAAKIIRSGARHCIVVRHASFAEHKLAWWRHEI